MFYVSDGGVIMAALACNENIIATSGSMLVKVPKVSSFPETLAL